MLEFSPGRHNRKLKLLGAAVGKRVYSFSLLSGYTCPFAKECKSMAVGGRIVDGPECKFRCFSASQEAMYKSVYAQRERNTEAIRALLPKGAEALASAINESLPKSAEAVRIHVAGDFLHARYFQAWCLVAKMNPQIHFYAYTKALPLLKKYSSLVPQNLRITMSRGGTHDKLIPELKKLGFHEARVVFDENTDLPIDHDDTHAYKGGEDFALLIHGTQPRKAA